jgi:site-specific DNA-methyltransferase (adenine-specific)
MVAADYARETMIHMGDCVTVMRTMSDQSVDAVVTDPPYELGFMGKSWDASGVAYRVEVWAECLRLLKPGGHLLAFGGSRTYHRLACAIEDAGFEIRDQIMWVYGSGFPKSLDVSKAISKTEASDDARRWQGWGTALKPSHEPIVLARKPLDGTVAETVLTHGTGALNIDGCRVPGEVASKPQPLLGKAIDNRIYYFRTGVGRNGQMSNNKAGRWPANFIHDGSDEVLELFPETRSGAHTKSSEWKDSSTRTASSFVRGMSGKERSYRSEASSGSAARFFYCAKASRAEREAGLDDFNPKRESDRIADDLPGGDNPRNRTNTARRNHHPTVKPIALMRYLIRLVTPPNGVVLDPFTGSGTTGIAARLDGFKFVGIEQSAEYADIAQARINHA